MDLHKRIEVTPMNVFVLKHNLNPTGQSINGPPIAGSARSGFRRVPTLVSLFLRVLMSTVMSECYSSCRRTVVLPYN